MSFVKNNLFSVSRAVYSKKMTNMPSKTTKKPVFIKIDFQSFGFKLGYH